MRAPRWALLGAALALACGGGGGGGGGPTGPPSGISYSPSNSGATLVLVEAAGSTATVLRLELRAQSIVGLYGVAFDLVYPSAQLSFVGVTEGTFLAGATTSLQSDEPTPGRVVVGLSRLGAVGGVTGSGTLMTLEFRSRGVAGAGTLSFDENAAFNAQAAPMTGVTWGGGSVSVVP